MRFTPRFTRAFLWIVALVPPLMTGCLPPVLAKYRDQSSGKKSESFAIDTMSASHDATAHSEDSQNPQSTKSAAIGGEGLSSKDQRQASPHSETAAIYAVDDQTYRIMARDEDVWDAVLDVLLKHYTLTIVDRQTGIISTEWDTFMRANIPYRNKLSLRMRRSARNFVDLTIHNGVERLRGVGESGGSLGGVWLPSEDPGQEVRRIVQNLAILLDLPPPLFPPEGVATAVGRSPKSI